MSDLDDRMSVDHDSDTKVSDTKERKSDDKYNRLNELKDLMEFYFSESNLSKDRFLKQQLESSECDGYIDLSIFLRFNKIRLLTSSLRELGDSLNKSDLIELNEDRTMIRRKTPFVEPSKKQIDKRTIYVENLTQKMNSDSLKKYFEQFGKISYISLPKFKSSDQSRGFGFIEFNEKESAKKVVEQYKDLINESDYSSMGKFPKSNSQIMVLEKKIQKLNEEISEYENENKIDIPGNKANNKPEKRTKNESEDESVEPKKKLNKNSEPQKENNPSSNKSKDPYKNLKVISKKQWLELKENFLNNQKERIKELKKIQSDLTKHLDELKNKKIHNDPTRQESDFKTSDIAKESIIRVTLDLNNESDFNLLKLTRQQFKDTKLSKDHLEHVAYVDIEKKSNKIYIRCKSADSANAIIKDSSFLTDLPNKIILTGKEEEEYLNRIKYGRNKYQIKKDKKQTSEKVIAQVDKPVPKQVKMLEDKNTSSKHIKFDDDNDD